jgi:thiamine transporter
MRSERTRLLVEIGLTVALCAALKFFRVILPVNVMGGDISLEMLPIMILALRRGVVAGVIAGTLWGCLAVINEPQFVVAPIQFLLDYPLAFAAVGLTGLGSRQWRSLMAAGKVGAAEAAAAGWMVVGGVARFTSHFVSGVVFFGSSAPAGQPVLAYSFFYNVSYMVPSLVLCVTAALVVLPVLERAVPSAGPAIPAVR